MLRTGFYLAALLIGLRFIALFLWNIIYDFYFFLFVRHYGSLIDFKKKGGEWALVTGGGAGIGRGYALALAKKGLNVCVMGRTESKLVDVAKYIKDNYGVQTKVVVHEFADCTTTAENIKELLGEEFDRIGVLVNNVGTMGMQDDFARAFSDIVPNPVDFGQHMVNVNVQSMVLMCGIFLPRFISQNRGILINVASAAAIRPFYGNAVYHATKSFVDFFTESLRQEAEDSGPSVIIQTVYPFFVKTNLIPEISHAMLPDVFAPNAEDFSTAALDTVGYQSRTSGCLTHNVQYRIFKFCHDCLPNSVFDKLGKRCIVALRDGNIAYRKKSC